MRKLSGAEWKAFMAADWDTIAGGKEVYYDGAVMVVDGVEVGHIEEDIADTARVAFTGGVVLSDMDDVDIPLEAFYTRWKRGLTHETLVVQVPKESLSDFHSMLKLLGGRDVK